MKFRSKSARRLVWIVTHPMSADYLLRGQLRYFRENGFEVSVIASPGPQLERVAQREGVPVYGIPIPTRISPASDLETVLRIAWLLVRLRPTVVLAGTPPAARLGLLAARLLRVPVRIYWLKGLTFEDASGAVIRSLARRERRVAACAHEIFCVSESLRQKYLELDLDRKGKSRVIGHGSGNGVNTDRFRPAREGDVCSLRREFSIPADATVIGWVGRLAPNKGIADLATVFFERVRKEHPEACLLLVGGPDPYNSIDEDLYGRLESDSRVRLTGYVDDPAPYYRVMDLFIFPSFREGMPNAPLEASASALPIVGYAATGTVDAAANGHTGTLVPVGDVSGLAEATLAYLRSPDLARRHGTAGRERTVELFRQEVVWEAIRDAVLEAVARRLG